MSFDGDLYPEAGATSVMTTKGDIVRYDSQRERYGIGSANQILQVKSSLPSWQTVPLADTVLTTAGDILYEDATPALARLASGTQYNTLQMGATLPAWSPSATSVMTTTGDLLYASGANTLARLAGGTSGDVLTANGAGVAPSYQTPAGGGGNWVLVGEASAVGANLTLSISPAVAQSDIICLCAIVRCSTSATGTGMIEKVNGLTSANYSTDGFWTEGTATGYMQTSGQSQWDLAMSGGSTQDTQIISYLVCNINDKITAQTYFSATNSGGMQTGYLNVGSQTTFSEVRFEDGAGGSLGTGSNLVVYKLTK